MRFNHQARAGYKYWPPCGVPVIMQHQCQQSLFMNPVCFSSSTEWWTFQLHADLGTHSAHCAVVLSLLLCNDRCPGWGVHKLWSSAVAVSLGSRNAWFDYGYLFCIIQGGFWKNFYDFPRDWVDSDPGVNSRRSLHTWPMRKWPCSSSIMAVACVYWFCL